MSDAAPGPAHEGRELALWARKVAIVFLFAIGMVVLWLARDVLLLIFIAGILAAGIAPAVRRVQVWARLWFKRRIRRGTAVLIVYFPFLLAAGIGGVVGIPYVVAESSALAREFPGLIREQLEPLRKHVPLEDLERFIAIRSRTGPLPVFGYIRGVVTFIAAVVAVLFMIVYMLIEAEKLRNLFLLLYPAEQRARQRRIIRRLSRRMSSWLGAQLTLAAIIGVATFIGLVSLDIPYPVPLAVIAAIGEMVPVIGPILGAIPVLAIAIMQSKWQFWAALALAILIQQLENYLLVPRLMGRRVSISPLSVFIAFLVGGTLFGIIGAMIAVPAAAIIQVAFEEYFLVHRERRQDQERPGSLLRRG